MAQLTAVQIGKVLHDAGFRGFPLQRGIAIVLAESGGNTRAVNTVGNSPPGSRDRGLWQINSYWHREVSDSCAFDPACASKAAFRISSRGMSFSQWSASTNGAYKKHMPAAARAVETLKKQGYSGIFTEGSAEDWTSFDLTDVGGIVAKPWEILKPIVQFFGALLNPGLWVRIVQVIGGGLMILAALFLIFKDQLPIPIPRRAK